MLGILGNAAEEYLGVGYQGDADGRAFDGSATYDITFAPGDEPPVGEFWSITLYDDRQRLYANPLDRRRLGRRCDSRASDRRATGSHAPELHPAERPVARRL